MLRSFYTSDAWYAFRKAYLGDMLLERGELRCERCGKPLVNPYDAILHHKIELTESNYADATISLNPANIMLVCHWCHDAIHERWGHQISRHVYLVYGCPCSGKRAYVDANRGSKDVVLDIDAIYACLGGNRAVLKSDMFAVYNVMQDRIRTRAGKWRNAWILSSAATQGDLRRLDDALGGCELINIEKPLDACYAEADSRGGEWRAWVDEWVRRHG